jgi:hypothetical protein
VTTPIQVFTVIVLFSLPTVMFGGYSLLRLSAAQKLTDFQRIYFRAGHAHAGVLLVLALAALDVLGKTDLGTGAQWVLGAILAIGVLAQSGGMFVHMGVGQPGRWSWGNTMSTVGALFLATALIWLAIGVITA